MSQGTQEVVGWRDEGIVPVVLISLSYIAVLVPMLVWGLLGVLLGLFGALVTVAMWQGAGMRDQAPSPATRCAVWMLGVWAPWAVLGRALVGWLSN